MVTLWDFIAAKLHELNPLAYQLAPLGDIPLPDPFETNITDLPELLQNKLRAVKNGTWQSDELSFNATPTPRFLGRPNPNTPLGENGAVALAIALHAKRCSLRKLNLEWNGVGDGGVINICAALSSYVTLQELYLNFNHFREPGSEAVAEFMRINTHLRTLNVGYEDLPKNAILTIFRACNVNHTLENLILGNTHVDSYHWTEAETQEIYDLIAHNHGLKMIKFVTRSGLSPDKLIEAMQKNYTLSSIVSLDLTHYKRLNECFSRNKKLKGLIDRIKEEKNAEWHLTRLHDRVALLPEIQESLDQPHINTCEDPVSALQQTTTLLEKMEAEKFNSEHVLCKMLLSLLVFYDAYVNILQSKTDEVAMSLVAVERWGYHTALAHQLAANYVLSLPTHAERIHADHVIPGAEHLDRRQWRTLRSPVERLGVARCELRLALSRWPKPTHKELEEAARPLHVMEKQKNF